VRPGIFPLDEELALLPGALTPSLVESAVRVGTEIASFERAADLLAYFTGVRVDEATVRRWTETAGAVLVAVETAEQERLERELPASPAGPAVLQGSVDGAHVPLVGGEWAEVKTLAVGVVEMCRGADGEPVARTRELSYFSRLADQETFRRQAWPELHRRGLETAGEVIWLADGSDWCYGFGVYHREAAVFILDFMHAAEHLAAAARATFGPQTPAATDWLTRQCHDLKHGDPATVLAALLTLPTGRAPDPAGAAETARATFEYFAKRWNQIQYAAFLARGYPIGSGSVESANKLVVEARLKGSGMHWSRHHVSPLVALRAVLCSGRWARIWPQIDAALRQRCRDAQTHRRARRAASIPPEPAAGASPPSAPACPAPAPTAPPTRPKTIVNGRPTANHPWRRSNSRFFPKRAS
jgi:hypothetical protein